MQDRIPVNPGRVLISPENGSAYYATMTRADNPTQSGDPLNKATFLKDDTAALFGLDHYSVPDDVLKVLSRFQNGLGNEYVWGKSGDTIIPAGTTYTTAKETIASGGYALKFFVASNISVDENGKISLVSPSAHEIYADVDTLQNLLRGKYYYTGSSATTGLTYVKYMPENSVVEVEYSSSASAFVYDATVRTYTGYPQEIINNSYSYVNSPDPNAYPVDDGYTYTALGRLGNKVQIATGSYKGTGKYGSSNKNSLTFDFKPKIWGIYAHDTSNSNKIVFTTGMILPFESLSPNYGVSVHPNGPTSTSGFWTISVSGNTVSWWVGVNGEQNAYTQANTSGDTYYYFAIG